MRPTFWTARAISIQRKIFWEMHLRPVAQGDIHKEYGITAKGHLSQADRHLRNLNIDYLKNQFTVVGIGDMGGDVFGKWSYQF